MRGPREARKQNAMEVIEISDSDEGEAEATLSTRSRVSSCDTIVISSSSDLEDSPDNRKYSLKISAKRLAKLRDITKEKMRNRNERHTPTENTGSGEKAGFQKSTAPQIQETICKESPARKKLSFYKDKHKSPVKLSPKLKQTTLNLESFSPTKLCTAKLSSERSSELPYLPPQHVIPSCLTRPNSKAQYFSEAQMLFLDCLYEEKVLQSSFIYTLKRFTTNNHKPTPELVKTLLKILLTSKKMSDTCSSYHTLTLIHTLHPNVAACAVEELKWDFVQEIVELLDVWQDFEDECTCNNVNSITTQNAVLALAFMVNVLESDIKRKQDLRKSKAFQFLSCLPNVEKVVEWIRGILPLNLASAAQPLISGLPGCHQDVLSLCQRLLKLAIDASSNPVDWARMITNGPLIWAYMHPSLTSVECKTLLIESIQSHLLRSTFIELIFNNYCQDFTNPLGCGLERVFGTYFLLMPPSYSVGSPSAYRSQAECEELVMLLAFLLQSYVFSQETPSEPLHHVDKHVADLKQRLETLCGPLSEKSYAFLDLMTLTIVAIRH